MGLQRSGLDLGIFGLPILYNVPSEPLESNRRHACLQRLRRRCQRRDLVCQWTWRKHWPVALCCHLMWLAHLPFGIGNLTTNKAAHEQTLLILTPCSRLPLLRPPRRRHLSTPATP